MSVGATLTRQVVSYPARWCALILDIPKLCTVSKLVPDVLSKVVNYCFQNPLLSQKSRTADQRMRTQTIIGYACLPDPAQPRIYFKIACTVPPLLFHSPCSRPCSAFLPPLSTALVTTLSTALVTTNQCAWTIRHTDNNWIRLLPDPAQSRIYFKISCTVPPLLFPSPSSRPCSGFLPPLSTALVTPNQ